MSEYDNPRFGLPTQSPFEWRVEWRVGPKKLTPSARKYAKLLASQGRVKGDHLYQVKPKQKFEIKRRSNAKPSSF